MAAGLGLIMAGAPAARAAAVLPPVFSSHMVLQSGRPAPVWGTAAAGEQITVRFRDLEKTAVAGVDGKWRVMLDPLTPGGPDRMEIVGSSTNVLEDVLVGEVWLGSGQSNMAGSSRTYRKQDPVLDAAIAAAPYARLRLFRSGGAGWQTAGADELDGYSALLASFGMALQKELDVPVGLMVGAVGGTPSGFWISEQAYRADEACRSAAAAFARTYDFEGTKKNYAVVRERWEQAAAAAKADGKNPPRQPIPPQPAGECHAPIGNLYERLIRPLIPYGIRGVLWDQGESGTAITGVDQYTLMGALLRSWRQDWGQGDFPFIYMQKPSGGGCAWDPADPATRLADVFAPLPPAPPLTKEGLSRELHIRLMRHPGAVMAVCSDLGGGTHPVNKSGYGARAARTALGAVYGRPLTVCGPLYDSYQVEGGKIRVRFKHVGQGLAWRHGDQLQGFAVAGTNRVFHWAEAVIENETVLAGSPAVPQPVALRYAWGATHPWANLFNRDGLPALAGRTDDW